jgi:hypothetical protein
MLNHFGYINTDLAKDSGTFFAEKTMDFYAKNLSPSLAVHASCPDAWLHRAGISL